MATEHKWRFFRAGGFDQVKLETGADLINLDKLDQKLWVALACPTTGLEFDARTLTLIDTDKDGRIRAPELIAAIKWAGALLKNVDDLVKAPNPLPLSSINDSTPAGKQALVSARQILDNLGKKDTTAISVDDTVDTAKIFAQTAFNGDGVIVEESAADDTTKTVIRDIVSCMGADADRSGKPGLTQGKIDLFFSEAQGFSDWWKLAETDPAILPLDGSTAAAAVTFRALRTKIDDYFSRCRLAAFDPRSVNALNREEKEYVALAAKDLSPTAAELAGWPLAHIDAGKPLPLRDGINPAWAALMEKFETDVVRPILNGKATISEADWMLISKRFSAHESWTAAKAGDKVEKLGLARVREILGTNTKSVLTELIAKDKAEEGKVAAITTVEKLTRFVRDLRLLCVNFVNFKDFYDRGDAAIFQAGTLYLDQRSCELTLPVDDAGKHASMAGLAGAYLAYCDCFRKGTGEKRGILAVFSQGDDDNLMVGRNGVFYDRKNRDWDATITKVIANPISLRQAFWLPYKKFVRMIEELIAKRAAAADASSSSKLQQAAGKVAEADKTAKPAQPAEPRKVDVGTVAALGVAFGSIGAFLGIVWANILGVIKLGPLAIAAAFIGLLLLISGPSLVLAYIKLRKRNLGPILDANGWAINARAKINVPFGTTLTGIAKLPPGAERDLADPYAEKKSAWPKIIGFALLLYIIYAILNHLGYIYQWTDGRLGTARLPAKVEIEATVPANTTTTVVTPAPLPETAPTPPAPK